MEFQERWQRRDRLQAHYDQTCDRNGGKTAAALPMVFAAGPA